MINKGGFKMTKQEIIFGRPDPKKHSIRYFALDEKAIIESIYVRKEHLGTPVPKQLKMTLEEIK
jgi:hypothetical protein